MTDHVLTRRKLKAITSKDEFNAILDKCILSDNYKEMTVQSHGLFIGGKQI